MHPERFTSRPHESRKIADALLQEARTPAGIPEYEGSDSEAIAAALSRRPLGKRNSSTIASCMALARELRETFSEATADALALLTDEELVDESRLYDRAKLGRRKPRITLSANYDTEGYLQLSWRPTRDADAPPVEDFSDLCEGSDFLTLGGEEEEDLVLLELFGEEFEEMLLPEDQRTPATDWANQELTNAFFDGLRGFVRALEAVCEVTLDSWPAYEQGIGVVIWDEFGRASDMSRFALQRAHEGFAASVAVADEFAREQGLQGVEQVQLLMLSGLKEQELRAGIEKAAGKPFGDGAYAHLCELVTRVMAKAQVLQEVAGASLVLEQADLGAEF